MALSRSGVVPVSLFPRQRRQRWYSVQTYSDLEVSQRGKIDRYLDILLDWNTRMNLTAIQDRQQAIERHINDSLAILPALDACLEYGQHAKVIDIGSGAGLPGLVLATARPLWHVCLLDSLKKRCAFTTAAVEAMGLDNVEVVWSRAEDAGRDEKCMTLRLPGQSQRCESWLNCVSHVSVLVVTG
jgi:16S rRNA (guanine(527)-N(7))-methyltransferase RsmG